MNIVPRNVETRVTHKSTPKKLTALKLLAVITARPPTMVMVVSRMGRPAMLKVLWKTASPLPGPRPICLFSSIRK